MSHGTEFIKFTFLTLEIGFTKFLFVIIWMIELLHGVMRIFAFNFLTILVTTKYFVVLEVFPNSSFFSVEVIEFTFLNVVLFVLLARLCFESLQTEFVFLSFRIHLVTLY